MGSVSRPAAVAARTARRENRDIGGPPENSGRHTWNPRPPRSIGAFFGMVGRLGGSPDRRWLFMVALPTAECGSTMLDRLPVWTTIKSILAYCWQERRLAARYAAVPVLCLIILDIVGVVAGVDIAASTWWPIATGAVALLVYA